MQNSLSQIVRAGSIALVALCFFLVPGTSRAADISGYDYYDTYTPADTPTYDYYDTYTPVNTPTYDYYDTYTPVSPTYDYYDTYTPSYGTSYSYTPTYSYTSGGYSTGGGYYVGGGYSTGGGYYVGGGGYTVGGGCTGCGCSGNCNPPPVQHQPTCTISANPTSITQGQPVTIVWNSQYANSGSITNIGSVNTSGSQTVYPTTSTTYTATFVGTNGQTVTCSTSVGVLPHENPAPWCSLTVSQSYFNDGYGSHPVTLSWNSNYATSGWINNGVGNVSNSGSRTVYPTQTTTYTGTFYGQNGQQVTCSATVNINHYVPPVVYTNPPATPYVTLSQVPYTGLDLGPVGTFLYWSFLVIWCVLAAYLVAVKRVQVSVYHSLKSLLFGSKGETHATHTSTHAAHDTHAHSTPATPHSNTVRPTVANDAIDSFILTQINRHA